MIRDIAQRVAGLSFGDLSGSAKERLLLALLGNLSVAVAGVRYTLVPAPPEGGKIRLFSGQTTSDPRAAAFWNAAAMHSRTQDDFHPVGNLHIGTVVTPALLALADETELSGADFVDGLAAGYMVAVGLSRLFSPKTTPRGLRSTSLYAPFGATAAVARARHMSVDAIASALALTTAFNAGQTQTWVDGTDEWQVHTGVAAQSGLVATALAAAGVRGGDHALDGPAGFYRAVVGEEVTFARVQSDFDNPSLGIEENVLKRYPVSGICQSVVLAAERAVAQLDAKAQPRAVRIEMNSFEIGYPGNMNRGPFRSFSDKLMSAAFCASSVVASRGFTFGDFHSGGNAARDALIAATEVVVDPALPLLSSRVTLTTADGKTVTGQVANSRAEVALDGSTIDPWAIGLWEEGGRTRQDYERCRDAVRGLPRAANARLPL